MNRRNKKMANPRSLDYDTRRCLEKLQAIAYMSEDSTETYDLQLNLIYEWVKTSVIDKRQFKQLLGFLVG